MNNNNNTINNNTSMKSVMLAGAAFAMFTQPVVGLGAASVQMDQPIEIPTSNVSVKLFCPDFRQAFTPLTKSTYKPKLHSLYEISIDGGKSWVGRYSTFRNFIKAIVAHDNAPKKWATDLKDNFLPSLVSNTAETNRRRLEEWIEKNQKTFAKYFTYLQRLDELFDEKQKLFEWKVTADSRGLFKFVFKAKKLKLTVKHGEESMVQEFETKKALKWLQDNTSEVANKNLNKNDVCGRLNELLDEEKARFIADFLEWKAFFPKAIGILQDPQNIKSFDLKKPEKRTKKICGKKNSDAGPVSVSVFQEDRTDHSNTLYKIKIDNKEWVGRWHTLRAFINAITAKLDVNFLNQAVACEETVKEQFPKAAPSKVKEGRFKKCCSDAFKKCKQWKTDFENLKLHASLLCFKKDESRAKRIQEWIEKQLSQPETNLLLLSKWQLLLSSSQLAKKFTLAATVKSDKEVKQAGIQQLELLAVPH